LKDQIDALEKGKVVGFLLGTRKGDPNCGDLQIFSPSRLLISYIQSIGAFNVIYVKYVDATIHAHQSYNELDLRSRLALSTNFLDTVLRII
jgi:hypothetical protein